MQDGIEALIRGRLKTESVPQDSGLKYYCAHPASRLARIAEVTGSDAPPYWAHLWPGGAALIGFLKDNPSTVTGKTVLDFGCGGGLAGIAAKRHGAARVICHDADEIALAAARLNAELNGVTIETLHAPIEIDMQNLDVVLAGDVFYDALVAQSALTFLRPFAERGTRVFIGDVGRACLPNEELNRIAAYDVRDVGDNAATQRQAGVFQFSFREGSLN